MNEQVPIISAKLRFILLDNENKLVPTLNVPSFVVFAFSLWVFISGCFEVRTVHFSMFLISWELTKYIICPYLSGTNFVRVCALQHPPFFQPKKNAYNRLSEPPKTIKSRLTCMKNGSSILEDLNVEI